MTKYQKRVIHYEDVDLDEDQVMTMSEAADELGISLYTVITNVNSARFTEIIDTEKTWQNRRLVLKSEVEEWKETH